MLKVNLQNGSSYTAFGKYISQVLSLLTLYIPIPLISVKIGEVAFIDLSQSGVTQIIEVNQAIEENNNPKGYAVGVFLRILGVIANAKNQADF